MGCASSRTPSNETRNTYSQTEKLKDMNKNVSEPATSAQTIKTKSQENSKKDIHNNPEDQDYEVPKIVPMNSNIEARRKI